MTRVDFIVNLQNIISQTATLCENYLKRGRSLTINCGSSTMQNTLSDALWQHSEISFLPHQTVGEAELQHAPIHLYIGEGKVIQDDILINLDQEVPLYFGRFNQLIELVDAVESNKIAARTRWKFYRDRGYVLRSTDSSQNNG